MKKTFCLFGTFLVASTTFTSCSEQEEQPKNYYGVQPSKEHGTPKEAYYAFFGGIVILVIGVLWIIKKLSKK